MASALRRQVGGLALALVSLGAGVGPAGIQIQRDAIVQPAPAGTASIAGRIDLIEGTRATPVRRARVTAECAGRPQQWRVDTDTDGKYRIDRLPAGSYRILVEKAGFVPIVADPRRSFEASAPFEVREGQVATLDVRMQRGAAFEGVLTAENGEPAVNIAVLALRVSADPAGPPAQVRQTKSDDRGRYRLHTLPPGQYFIAGGRSYYPGTTKMEEARAMSLSAGQTVNADFVVTSPPVALGRKVGAIR